MSISFPFTYFRTKELTFSRFKLRIERVKGQDTETRLSELKRSKLIIEEMSNETPDFPLLRNSRIVPLTTQYL